MSARFLVEPLQIAYENPVKQRLKTRRGEVWTTTERRMLGSSPDSVVAEKTRRTIKEVVAERERLRIRMETAQRRWSAREIKLLGHYNDAEVSRRLRRPYSDVRAKRLELHEKLLGTCPDAELARRWGIPIYVVSYRRRELRIPKAPRPPKVVGRDEEIGQLGTMSDAKIAARIGKTITAVKACRTALGIP